MPGQEIADDPTASVNAGECQGFFHRNFAKSELKYAPFLPNFQVSLINAWLSVGCKRILVPLEEILPKSLSQESPLGPSLLASRCCSTVSPVLYSCVRVQPELVMFIGGDNEGLFRGAIMESGAPIPVESEKRGQHSFDVIAEAAGCHNAVDKVACLRAVSFEDLHTATSE